MYQPRVFCVKLQLHFGGDIHEISVPAYNGAEPTVNDLMDVIERDFRVPRALQNIVFHGQELHPHSNVALSCFGIKNLGTIRLVGRMAPPDQIQQINSQYGSNSYQQINSQYGSNSYQQINSQYGSNSYQQMNYTQQPNVIATFHTTEQSLPYYYEQKSSVGTQYDPPSPNKDQPPPPPTPNRDQPPPPPTPNRDQPPPPTPNKDQLSNRFNGEEQKPPATPNSSNTK